MAGLMKAHRAVQGLCTQRICVYKFLSELTQNGHRGDHVTSIHTSHHAGHAPSSVFPRFRQIATPSRNDVITILHRLFIFLGAMKSDLTINIVSV